MIKDTVIYLRRHKCYAILISVTDINYGARTIILIFGLRS